MASTDVRARAMKLDEDLRRRTARERAASAVVVLGCVAIAAMATATVLTRVACAAGVVAALHAELRVRSAGRSARPADDSATDDAWRASLAGALARRRDLQATAWRWYVVPFAATMALFLLAAAFELMTPLPVVLAATAACVAVSLAVVVASRRAAASLQRELDALERPEG